MNENEERFWEALANGYCFCDAQNITAAKIAVELHLGEYRIGRRVMYKPVVDIETNRARHIKIRAIQA